MRVGWIGLGKLGLPCALVLAQYHDVTGYDVSDKPWRVLSGSQESNREEGMTRGLMRDADDRPRIRRAGFISDVVAESDIIFTAVQTPHAPEYGGDRPMPETRRDFEYAYLAQACRDVAAAAQAQRKQVTLVVVSTVLPGTTNRVIRPLLNQYVRLVYSPQFIAMGTTVADFQNPEFVVCGTDGGSRGSEEAEQLASVFFPVHNGNRLYYSDITTAESIKVLYNTFISMKIVWANQVMEMCHATGADCDAVVDALSMATDRVISPKYLSGGMGDGGACHPRDLIAMSWLENRLGMSTDLFGQLAVMREQQTRWLADLALSYSSQLGMPVTLLGEAYKPGSDLTDGSPALLLHRYLVQTQRGGVNVYDPYVPGGSPPPASLVKGVYVITAKHEDWLKTRFARGSVVIDPFGYLEDQDGVTTLRVGRN